MSEETGPVNYIMNMPDPERASMLDSLLPARVLADAMQLNGAKVRGGDVQHALARLGLRLVSVDEPDPERTHLAADARYASVTESAPCDCGFEWVQLRDAGHTGTGWWHHGREGDENGFYRKCRAGNSAPRGR